MENIIVDIFEKVAIPVLTLLGGWFGHMIRTKQKKEADILDNVTQILQMQKDYISQQQETISKQEEVLIETRKQNRRIEAKLDKKDRAIRKANWCKFTNEGDGCPVLNEDERIDQCHNCEFLKKEDDAKGESSN